jgi:hypothetical protein
VRFGLEKRVIAFSAALGIINHKLFKRDDADE